jgi:hypothetical protein
MFCGCNDRDISDHWHRAKPYEHPHRQAQPLLSLSAARLAAVVVALLGPLGAASTAHAGANDDLFLATLKREDIAHVSSEAAIEAGHTVCQKREQAMTPHEVAYDVPNGSSLPGCHSAISSARAYVRIARSTRLISDYVELAGIGDRQQVESRQ